MPALITFSENSRGETRNATRRFQLLAKRPSSIPTSRKPIWGRGFAWLVLKKYEEAIPPLRNAERLMPGNPEVHHTLATALQRSGHKEEAEKEFAIHRSLVLPPGRRARIVCAQWILGTSKNLNSSFAYCNENPASEPYRATDKARLRVHPDCRIIALAKMALACVARGSPISFSGTASRKVPGSGGFIPAASPRKSTCRKLPAPGCAFLDYDNDGWMDIYLVNSGTCDFFTPDPPLRNALYRNNRDGTFTDVTEKAGVAGGGYGRAWPSAITTVTASPTCTSRNTAAAFCITTMATALSPT